MIAERIRGWFTPGPDGPQASVDHGTLKPVQIDAEPIEHVSHGLEQALQSLPPRPGLAILDLGEINQSNVEFVTGLGHRHYSEHLMEALDREFGSEPYDAEAWQPDRHEDFLDRILQFHGGQFDAVFIWDVLQFVPPPVLGDMMDRLMAITKPGGVLFAVFHGGPRRGAVPVYSFRMANSKTLRVAPKQERPPAQLFNNRSLEELFEGARSTKLFLTRDSLREVIVRR